MKFLLVLLLITTSMQGYSQTTESWKINLNKAVIFKGNLETNNPVVEVNANEILKLPKAIFTIDYRQPSADKAWKRTFFINNSADETLHSIEMNSQNGRINFPAAYVINLVKAHQPVFIYSSTIPKDVNKAAVVRVRRILLCKLVWK